MSAETVELDPRVPGNRDKFHSYKQSSALQRQNSQIFSSRIRLVEDIQSSEKTIITVVARKTISSLIKSEALARSTLAGNPLKVSLKLCKHLPQNEIRTLCR